MVRNMKDIVLNLVNIALEINPKENEKKYNDAVKNLIEHIGSWDSSSTYHIKDEYMTKSSSFILPDRSWTMPHYLHVFTKKYLTQLKQKLEDQ